MRNIDIVLAAFDADAHEFDSEYIEGNTLTLSNNTGWGVKISPNGYEVPGCIIVPNQMQPEVRTAFDAVLREYKLLPKKLVVTRHVGLVEYLLDIGVIVEGQYEVVAHATPEVVTGKDVVGVLPHSLSCLCSTFTEVPMHIPVELRGQELTLEQMHLYGKPPVTYKVQVV